MRHFLSFLCAICIAAPVWAADETRVLSVTGQGEVTAAPDMATVTLGVEAVEKTADAAMANVSRDTAAILNTLTRAGIEARDMQTSGLNLHPVWSTGSGLNPTRRIDGFSASNVVTVRVRDLDILGGLLDRVISDGANRFRGLSFGLQNPDPLMDEARQKAVAEARRKALLFAAAAGVELGDLQSLGEAGGGVPHPMQMMEAARSFSADVPVAPGELTISAQVSMVYEIK